MQLHKVYSYMFVLLKQALLRGVLLQIFVQNFDETA